MKIKCKLCGDIIEGDKKGHLILCECGACAIDETQYYCRILGEPNNYEKISDNSDYFKYRRD